MSKEYNIDLSLGLKTIQINFEEDKEPVQIRFNPADDEFPSRLFAARKKIEKSASDIDNYFDENGEIDADKYIEAQENQRKAITEAIDYAFGAEISKDVFKYCSPTARTNGNLFILQFLEKVTPVIEKIINGENKKTSEYLNKAYGKYVKK